MFPNIASSIPRAILASGVLFLAANTANAHDFWVHGGLGTDADSGNPFVMTNVGWGHTLFPISEFLAGDRLASYRITDPNGKTLDLPKMGSGRRGLDAGDIARAITLYDKATTLALAVLAVWALLAIIL